MMTQTRVRYMRLILFFDLPMETAKQRKDYRLFRKFLIHDGYLMLQKSVYMKLITNDSRSDAALTRLRQQKPPAGLVQVLKVTEKQFTSMEYVTGEKSTGNELDTLEGFVVL